MGKKKDAQRMLEKHRECTHFWDHKQWIEVERQGLVSMWRILKCSECGLERWEYYGVG